MKSRKQASTLAGTLPRRSGSTSRALVVEDHGEITRNFLDEAVSDRTVLRIFHRNLHLKFGNLWRKIKLTELPKQTDRVMWSLLHAEDGWE